MTGIKRNRYVETLLIAALALAGPLALGIGSAWADTQYLDDGALQNARGGWDLPAQGTCPAGALQGYAGIDTRPECVALRLNVVQASCVSPNYSWNTSGVCNDLVNTTESACNLAPDRLWNPGTNKCAIVMAGDDRNAVTCALHNGNWITAGTCVGVWIMPARTAYTPNLLTGNGAGDQCLRCHNNVTQYNGPRVRDTEETLQMGHKNMARKVVVGTPWGGPPFACSNPVFTTQETCLANAETWDPEIYPSDDSGNMFDWDAGTITTSSGVRNLTWIYGDWLAALPRAIYKAPASTITKVCTDPSYTTQATCEGAGESWVFTAGASYSCARCHTTGWTSDAAINPLKEPEKSFSGITWDRNSNAPADVVNLAGGISGDHNQYGSWDVYGISCTRCHSSVVDNQLVACTGLTSGTCTGLGGVYSGTTCSYITPDNCTGNAGTIANYLSAFGQSSHHNNLTVPDFPTGCSAPSAACSGGRCTSSNCATAGGTWYYGYCTDARVLAGQGLAPAAAKTRCETGLGEPAPGFGPGVWITPCSDSNYATQTTCTGAGQTWTLPTTSCSVAGACNNIAGGPYTTQAACTVAPLADCPGGVTCQWAAATDVITCEDAGGRWNGSYSRRGQIITSLCMNCHRQETGGKPYDSGSDPAGLLKVGPAHGTVGFVSHAHGNQFLNSPHAGFTGSFTQIPTATPGAGYDSYFMYDGEAANTGNGCTGCHDVHTSTVTSTSFLAEECTECHSGAYAKSLTTIQHPSGIGTPLEEMDTNPSEACITCHMPEGLHLWRVNTSPIYSTIPATALTATVNASTSPEGSYTKAVWADMDMACGQCHGGGTSQRITTGNITGGAKVLAVTSATGLTVGERIRVAGAGALYYDEDGVSKLNQDFDSYIVSKAGLNITLAGNATKTVAGAAVVQNPTKNAASYKTKANLAKLAVAMHPESGRVSSPPTINFAYTLSGLTINLDATQSTCSGSSANCDEYTWSCGTGGTLTVPLPPAKAVTASCTYASAGSRKITLTVEQWGITGGTKSKTVTLAAPSTPPTVGGTCEFDANTWVGSVTDASTPGTYPIKQVTVNWGDGTAIASDLTAPFGPFSHTYLTTGTRTITHTAIDTAGKTSAVTCTAAPTLFTFSGTIYRSNGTTVVPTATVKLVNGSITKTVFSTASGTFSVGSLKPGTYTVTISKAGYTFPAVVPITVGPSSAGNVINAVTP